MHRASFQNIMAKKTASKPAKKAPAAKAKNELGGVMSGADILVAALEREGVDTIFAYPGGASMAMHQALTRSKKIRTILPRHEQGGVFAAQGYARVTGRAGVCMATSGPGAMNLVTGIADAFLDSTPLVAITGQVPRHMIGKGAFQETDVFGVTAPIVAEMEARALQEGPYPSSRSASSRGSWRSWPRRWSASSGRRTSALRRRRSPRSSRTRSAGSRN